jgi:hypothetical protein
MFGSEFFTKAILGKGLEMAFGGGDGKSAVQPVVMTPPSFNIHDMPIYASSKAEEVEGEFGELDVASVNYEAIKAMWDRRFASYTESNIILPKV